MKTEIWFTDLKLDKQDEVAKFLSDNDLNPRFIFPLCIDDDGKIT